MKILRYAFFAYFSAFVAIAPLFVAFLLCVPVLIGAFWLVFLLPIPVAIALLILSYIFVDYHLSYGRIKVGVFGMLIAFSLGIFIAIFNLRGLHATNPIGLIVQVLALAGLFGYVGAVSTVIMDMSIRANLLSK